MAKKDSKLEDKIVAALSDGPRTNRELRVALGLDVDTYDTALDRTLQSMRKGAKLHLVNRKWATPDVQTCATCTGRGWLSIADPSKASFTCPQCNGRGWTRLSVAAQATQ